MTPSIQLRQGIDTLGLDLSQATQEKMLAYVAGVQKWNRVFNLTALRDTTQMVSHHILDALAILPHLVGHDILDIGTGAGIPGLVLAIARPDINFTLLESNGKKVRFLRQTVHDLNINNAAVIHDRIEHFQTKIEFDALTSRALGKLSDMLIACQHLMTEKTIFLAMKGQYPEAEMQTLPPSFEVRSTKRIDVPGIEAARHLVIIARRE